MHCSTPSVGYQLSCMLCKEDGKDAVYEGETGRPAVTRMMEHIKGYQANKKENPLTRHRLTDHPSHSHKQVKFRFDLTRNFKDPLTRQAEEGVRISARNKLGNLINTKNEFHHPPVARVSIRK